jgi:parallel beta-helix repeat protein
MSLIGTIRAFLLPSVLLILSSVNAFTAQYSVSGWGAVGDGTTADTAAWQTASTPVPQGSVLDFGGSNKIYLIRSSLTLQPNVTYQGRATVLMSAQAPAHTGILQLLYGQSDNVTINGLTFDANGVGGILQMAINGLGAIPVNNAQIIYNTFRNATMSPAGGWDGAIYDPVGITNSRIAFNSIVNCGSGISLVNPNQTSVTDNDFYTVSHADAIFMMFSTAPFAFGQGLDISRNRGEHLGRMAVELWANPGTDTSQVQGVNIANNAFSDWDAGFDPQPFGISVMAGQSASITGNILRGGVNGTGLELGAPSSTVTGNTFDGFPVGISLLDSHGSTISSNLLTNLQVSGIEFTNNTGTRAGITVQNNRIIDAKNFGIFVNDTTWDGSTISGNSIWRNAGTYSDDAAQSFIGISITPATQPVVVSGNSVVQSSMTPPSTFIFTGIRVNGGGGTNAGSTYSNNLVLSKYMLTQSIGLFGNSPGTLDNTYVQNNTFQGLGQASSGSASSGMIGSGNITFNCGQLGPLAINQ